MHRCMNESNVWVSALAAMGVLLLIAVLFAVCMLGPLIMLNALIQDQMEHQTDALAKQILDT